MAIKAPALAAKASEVRSPINHAQSSGNTDPASWIALMSKMCTLPNYTNHTKKQILFYATVIVTLICSFAGFGFSLVTGSVCGMLAVAGLLWYRREEIVSKNPLQVYSIPALLYLCFAGCAVLPWTHDCRDEPDDSIILRLPYDSVGRTTGTTFLSCSVLAGIACCVVAAVPMRTHSRYARLCGTCILCYAFWSVSEMLLTGLKWRMCTKLEHLDFIVGITASMISLPALFTQFLLITRARDLAESLLLPDWIRRRFRDYLCIGSLSVACTLASVGFVGPFVASSLFSAVLNAACTVLVVKVFMAPLHVLGQEVRRTKGVASAEASWARNMVRLELCACLLTQSTTFLQGPSTAAGVLHAGAESTANGDFLDVLRFVVCYLDMLGNMVALAVLSGLWFIGRPKLEQPSALGEQSQQPRLTRTGSVDSLDNLWEHKVKELSQRAIRLEALLDFYKMLGNEVMVHFDPCRSTTNDVVRQAIIPMSTCATGGTALATVFNEGKDVCAQCIVTHNWANSFTDLVAAIVAHGLRKDTYKEIAVDLREGRVDELKSRLREQGSLHHTYWVCAFSVNQHANICGGFGTAPPESTDAHRIWEAMCHDTVTGERFEICSCLQKKFFNDHPAECEINKFYCMMAHLKACMVNFEQVVAIDESFDLFNRAWCVAELVEAESSEISQSVVIHSEGAFEKHYKALCTLDVQQCQATWKEDKDAILAKIGDIPAFNERLQWVIFGARGLLSRWMDAQDRMVAISRIFHRSKWAQSEAARVAEPGPCDQDVCV